MATYNKFYCFPENVCEKRHDLSSDSIRAALFAAADAPVATDTTLANIGTPITTNVASLSGSTTGLVFELVSSGLVSNVYRPIFYDMLITATGGAIAAFQYVVIYNYTAASGYQLIGWYDYGSALTLAEGEKLNIDLNQTNGLFGMS